MNFLKKFGQTVLAGSQLAVAITPLIRVTADNEKANATLDKIDDTMAGVQMAVMTAEVFGQALSLPGAEKAKAAAPLVMQALLAAPFMGGKKIDDQEKAMLAAQAMGQAMADFLNAVKA